MKKIPVLAFLIALLIMVVASEATVLVFKGTGTRFKGDNTTSSKVSTTVYFVIQYDNTGGTKRVETSEGTITRYVRDGLGRFRAPTHRELHGLRFGIVL